MNANTDAEGDDVESCAPAYRCLSGPAGVCLTGGLPYRAMSYKNSAGASKGPSAQAHCRS